MSEPTPTVELVAGAYYWIKRAYGDRDLWEVAIWEHGCLWDLNGQEVVARVISGPIPRPAESAPLSPSGEAVSAGNPSKDEQSQALGGRE